MVYFWVDKYKNIDSTDFHYLYNYTRLSKSSLSQKLYKKFENCLAYGAWKFAEEVSENHMFFAYKFFTDDPMQELEKPLNIAKETKGNILESFFVKAEKYKLSHEKTAIFIPIEQEYKQEKTIDDYINFSKEVFSIAEKDGLLAIDSLSQMEDYPFMDELMKMWATGIWKSSSDFFKLYIEQIQEQQYIKIKNYYRAIKLFTLMKKEFIHNFTIENIFSSYGISPKDTWESIENQEDFNNYTKLILIEGLTIDKYRLEYLLEFMKYISLVKKFLDKENFTVFKPKKSYIVNKILSKLEKLHFPCEMKIWSNLILLGNDSLCEFIKYIEILEKEEISEVSKIYEEVIKLIKSLEDGLK